MTPIQKGGTVLAVGLAIVIGSAWWYNSTKAPKACNENADCPTGSECVEHVCTTSGAFRSVDLRAVSVS